VCPCLAQPSRLRYVRSILYPYFAVRPVVIPAGPAVNPFVFLQILTLASKICTPVDLHSFSAAMRFAFLGDVQDKLQVVMVSGLEVLENN
jgi:hypothetical protein